MEKKLEEIRKFLNISMETLLLQPSDLIQEMVDAVNDEDMFKVHQLGYSVKSNS